MQPRTVYQLEVNPKIPARLARLEELASNLWYSWDRPTRTLFSRLHTSLWDAVGHNPKAFLRRVDEQVLIDAADDPVFLGNFNRVLSAYDTLSQRAAAPQRLGVAARHRPGGLLLRRVRLPRELSDLLGRPGHPRRGPLQGGQRHAPAVHRRGAALPPGLLLADHRHRGQPAGRVHRLRVREPAGHAGAARATAPSSRST